ncbi:MAG: DNA polymerase III subunit delta, partial [Kiloniellaceae bacterium]
FRSFLADPPGDALIVVEAGDLPARSALRKVFESAGRGAALACYRDDERSLPKLIDATLRAQGLRATPEARAFLAANLGGDRQVTRRELEKLALYKGPGGGDIELEDAQACVGDSAALSLEDLAFAVAGGELAELARALDRSFQEGAHPVAALRAVARHLQRLHLVAGLVRQGTPVGQAVKGLRPPVFWKRAARFKSQASAWPPAALGRALERLLAAETACKQTGAPADSLCGRALLEIASRAPARPRRPVG